MPLALHNLPQPFPDAQRFHKTFPPLRPLLSTRQYWYLQITTNANLQVLGNVKLVERRTPDAFTIDPSALAVLIVTSDVLGWLHSMEDGQQLLYKWRWWRLVVDEGHTMGRGATTNARRAVAGLYSERKWVVTGTPTPSTLSASGLSHLHKLLNTIGEPPFDTNRNAWRNLVQFPFDRHFAADAVWRLQGILSRVMVRHSKDILRRLPPPVRQTIMLPMSESERDAYNAVVAVIRANVVLTAMEGKVTGKVDSLLHESQTKYAREALNNSRIACVGGYKRICEVEEKAVDETCEMLEAFGVTASRIDDVRFRIGLSAEGHTSPCDACGLKLLVLLVVNCGCMCCAECVREDTRSCPVCSVPFDVDDFQRLQPGVTPVSVEEPDPIPPFFSHTALLDTLDAFDRICGEAGVAIRLPRANMGGDGSRTFPSDVDLTACGAELAGMGVRLGAPFSVGARILDGPAFAGFRDRVAECGSPAAVDDPAGHSPAAKRAHLEAGPSESQGEAAPSSLHSTEPHLPQWATSVLKEETLTRELQRECLLHTKARHIIQTVLSLFHHSATTGDVGGLYKTHGQSGSLPLVRARKAKRRARFADDVGGEPEEAAAPAGLSFKPGPLAKPYVKCIVFSQFGHTARSPLAVCGDKLVRVFGE
jgi:hypothetical protein